MVTTESLISDLKKVRSQSPLVHNITNYVVMNNTANALLAVGASPVMAHAVDEVEDMVKIASALVINIGTLSKIWVEAMLMAGKTAKEKSTPKVLDPVGAGATPYRTQTCFEIIKQSSPEVIRGNASEIMALVNESSTTKGVDSTASSESAVESAKILAKDTGAVVVISGPTDFITDGQNLIKVNNGTPLLGKVTGMGCSASALVGAFIAVNKNFLQASAHAMAVMGIAGEIAAKKCSGPGTMQIQFLDALYNLSEDEIIRYLNAE